MKAWTGLGLLEEVKEVFLNLGRNGRGSEEWEMVWDLGSSPGCPELPQALLSLLSSLWKLGGEEEKEEGRTGGKKVELLSGLLSTLWFSGGLSLLACSLMVADPVEGMNGRLFIRSCCCWARVGNSNSAGDYCSGGDGATGSGFGAEMEETAGCCRLK